MKKINKKEKSTLLLALLFLGALVIIGIWYNTTVTGANMSGTTTSTIPGGIISVSGSGTGGSGTPQQTPQTTTTLFVPNFGGGWTMPTFPSFTMPTLPCLFGCGGSGNTPTTSAPTTQTPTTTPSTLIFVTMTPTTLFNPFDFLLPQVTTIPKFVTTTTQPCYTDTDCGILQTCSASRGSCVEIKPICRMGAANNYCDTSATTYIGDYICQSFTRGISQCVSTLPL